jgi:hypothetical protein
MVVFAKCPDWNQHHDSKFKSTIQNEEFKEEPEISQIQMNSFSDERQLSLKNVNGRFSSKIVMLFPYSPFNASMQENEFQKGQSIIKQRIARCFFMLKLKQKEFDRLLFLTKNSTLSSNDFFAELMKLASQKFYIFSKLEIEQLKSDLAQIKDFSDLLSILLC